MHQLSSQNYFENFFTKILMPSCIEQTKWTNAPDIFLPSFKSSNYFLFVIDKITIVHVDHVFCCCSNQGLLVIAFLLKENNLKVKTLNLKLFWLWKSPTTFDGTFRSLRYKGNLLLTFLNWPQCCVTRKEVWTMSDAVIKSHCDYFLNSWGD